MSDKKEAYLLIANLLNSLIILTNLDIWSEFLIKFLEVVVFLIKRIYRGDTSYKTACQNMDA